MREIKFRAWDTVKKHMYSAEEMGEDQEALLPDGRGFANISDISVELTQIHSHLLPLQFTGLHDSTKWEQLTQEGQASWLASGKTEQEWNGKEIYEGDRVALHTILPSGDTASFCSGDVRLSEDGSWRVWIKKLGTSQTVWALAERLEVIGNIYELELASQRLG